MKKGFTLVELLAVIIILGILSVLIVPKVVDTLNDSEEKTNLASAEGLLKAAEYKYQDNEIKGISESIKVDYTNNINTDKLDFNGKKPEEGQIKITQDGKVSMAVKIGNNCYLKAVQDKEISVIPYSVETCIVKNIKLISDADNNGIPSLGDEYAIGDEHFYIINVNNNRVSMLSKYNLYVGYETECYKENNITSCEIPTEISTVISGYSLQNEKAKGWVYNDEKVIGILPFSQEIYWSEHNSLKSEYGDEYPAYVYDENSELYQYVENYVNYLKELGIHNTATGRLLNNDDLTTLECDYYEQECSNTVEPWLYSTSFWTGIADSDDSFMVFDLEFETEQAFSTGDYDQDDTYGIRPVIEIDLSEF